MARAVEWRRVEYDIEKTRAAMQGSDPKALEAAVDDLSTLSYQMTEALYATLGGEGE